MKFLNYPRQTPLSQPILSQPWGNLVVDAIMGVVKFRTREDGIVELDLERGARKSLTNVVTEKVGENLYYGIDVTIHWWASSNTQSIRTKVGWLRSSSCGICIGKIH